MLFSEQRRRWAALAVVCLGQLMMVLDMTIVNVALPGIQADMRFTQASLTWVLDAYMIAFGSFLLLAGRVGDLIGRKRVFLAGIVNASLQISARGRDRRARHDRHDRAQQMVSDGSRLGHALTAGYTLAWELGAVSVLAGIAVAVTLLRRPGDGGGLRRRTGEALEAA
jgi:MFS family permease